MTIALYSYISTQTQVETTIKESKLEGRKVGAVFITSPTYNGICSELQQISDICHSHGIPLIVDEAHGAHFKFHPEMPKTALEQGADISIQSTHKVLCSFSQSSMLHLSGQSVDRDRLHKCVHSLQSTSPNWHLLASLDASRHQLSINPTTIFNEAVHLANQTKILITAIPGISVLGLSDSPNFADMDPLRIGLSGFEANKILDDEFGIISELVGTTSITLAFSLGTTKEHVERLISALTHLSNFFSKRQSSGWWERRIRWCGWEGEPARGVLREEDEEEVKGVRGGSVWRDYLPLPAWDSVAVPR